jgi:hypothetical protein
MVRLYGRLGGDGNQFDSWSAPGDWAWIKMSSEPSALYFRGMEDRIP